MPTMQRWFLCLILFARPVAAGAQSSTVFTVDQKTVEVVGLRRWTVPMIQDSLSKYSPGDSLHHHACASVLRYSLGFADAAATSYSDDGREYVVVSVVEPQDSARVRYRRTAFDSVAARPEWSEAVAVLTRSPRVFNASASEYLAQRGAPRGPVPAHLARDSADVRRVWSFLDTHRREQDYELALVTLLADDNYRDRIVAATLLGNFPGRDPAWWALVEAMREEDGAVKIASATVLTHMSRTNPRPIDWRPAASAVHSMLNGTSLFTLDVLMDVLPRTTRRGEYAAPFLSGGGEMLLAYLGARRPELRLGARQALVAVSGQDFGFDQDRWRNWIGTLQAR